MSRPNNQGAIVSLKELERCRKAAPPDKLELFHVYVDSRSGDLVQVAGFDAPEGCVKALRHGGGEPFFPPKSCLREREHVKESVPPAEGTSCLAMIGKFIAYGILIIVIFFGLIFGFCAMNGFRR